jgi:DNA (cytosine-5)-methyltransferase 1
MDLKKAGTMSLVKRPLHFIDVFSGAGGFSTGLEMAGMRCVLGIDIDQHAIKTFARNHKYAEVYTGDVTKLSKREIEKLTNSTPIDLVVGGPPCQGFSTVGLGDPKDQRNSLFLQFVRLVRITNPNFVVIENVTGLLAKKNESTLKAIFKKFEALGYHLDVKVLEATDYGVPEVRRRTIILGSRLPVQIEFPKASHQKKPVTVGEALKNLKTKNGTLHNHDLDFAQIKNALDLKRLRAVPEGKGVRYEKDEQAYFKAKSLKLGIDWKKIPENRLRQAKYYRLDRKKPSPTIMTHRQSYYHPTEDRYLTQREAARLQSFPNNFIFEGPVSAQWRQIGNAVPPLLGRSIGKAILNMLKAYETGKHLEKNKRSQKKSDQSILTFRKKAFVYREKTKTKEMPLCALSS